MRFDHLVVHPDGRDRGPVRTLRRLARGRLALGRNPLRRNSDRIEAAVLAGLLLLLAAMIPLATEVARFTYGYELHESAIQTATRAPADAVVRSGARVGGYSGTRAIMIATIEWADRAGRRHTGTTVVHSGIRTGTHLQIWTTSSGERAYEPLTRNDAITDGVTAGIGIELLALAPTILTFGALRRGLDRLRRRDLGREWERLNRITESGTGTS